MENLVAISIFAQWVETRRVSWRLGSPRYLGAIDAPSPMCALPVTNGSTYEDPP